MARPLILVTNDDGIQSEGLKAAAQAAKSLGDVIVASSHIPQSVMGRSHPAGKDVGKIKEYPMSLDDGSTVEAYAIVGSPAQVVAYAIHELCERKPDILVSGVNFGQNLGPILTASGTIGAALEANNFGVKSLALSLQVIAEDSPESTNWCPIVHHAEVFIQEMLSASLPSDVSLLNVNFPRQVSLQTKVVITIDSQQPYFIFGRPNRTSFDCGAPLTVEITCDPATLEPNSDIQAIVVDGQISVTPINLQMASQSRWVPKVLKVDT